jgi:hypothetical protein
LPITQYADCLVNLERENDEVPDGATASKEDMLAAKKAVDAFRSDMEEYLACEKNFANLDAAQNELSKVADRFNLQIRAFKAKG